jgi:hypothetical protein
VHSAKDWRAVLEPVVARYQGRNLRRYFRADAAFANPELYEYLETEGFEYAIRLPANDALMTDIEPLLTRPVGRPSNTPGGLVCRLFVSGAELGSPPACGGQGGVAQRRTVPPRRVHRDQSNACWRSQMACRASEHQKAELKAEKQMKNTCNTVERSQNPEKQPTPVGGKNQMGNPS